MSPSLDADVTEMLSQIDCRWYCIGNLWKIYGSGLGREAVIQTEFLGLIRWVVSLTIPSLFPSWTWLQLSFTCHSLINQILIVVTLALTLPLMMHRIYVTLIFKLSRGVGHRGGSFPAALSIPVCPAEWNSIPLVFADFWRTAVGQLKLL